MVLFSTFHFKYCHPTGSLWLTAFVVKCFGQARQFINIDQKDLDLSIKWLLRNQKSDGEFPTIGRAVHKDMKGGLSDKKFGELRPFVDVVNACLQSSIINLQ